MPKLEEPRYSGKAGMALRKAEMSRIIPQNNNISEFDQEVESKTVAKIMSNFNTLYQEIKSKNIAITEAINPSGVNPQKSPLAEAGGIKKAKSFQEGLSKKAVKTSRYTYKSSGISKHTVIPLVQHKIPEIPDDNHDIKASSNFLKMQQKSSENSPYSSLTRDDPILQMQIVSPEPKKDTKRKLEKLNELKELEPRIRYLPIKKNADKNSHRFEYENLDGLVKK